jgi:hypothetical protein
MSVVLVVGRWLLDKGDNGVGHGYRLFGVTKVF